MLVDWYFGGAAVIAVLFVLNAIAYVVRRSRRQGATGTAVATPLLKRPQSGPQIAGGLLIAAVLLAGFAARTVAPESDLGKAMTDPWALVSLVLWMMAIGVVVTTVVTVLRQRRGQRR